MDPSKIEHDDHEFNARFDDLNERYAGSVPDGRLEYESWLEDCREEWEALSDDERAEIIASVEETARQAKLRVAAEDDLPF